MAFIFNMSSGKSYPCIVSISYKERVVKVFGEVIQGIEIIDEIAVVKTDRRDRPEEDIKIQSTMPHPYEFKKYFTL